MFQYKNNMAGPATAFQCRRLWSEFDESVEEKRMTSDSSTAPSVDSKVRKPCLLVCPRCMASLRKCNCVSTIIHAAPFDQLKSHQHQYPCHHCCCPCLRRTRHCHPHPHDHTWNTSYQHVFAQIKKASTYVSVSLIFAVSGSSPYAFRLLASSALYLSMTSPFSSW